MTYVGKAFCINNWNTTTAITLRGFQYELHTRSIPTNKNLYTCKLNQVYVIIVEVIYYVWEFPTIQHIWIQLVTFLSTKSIHIHATKQIAILAYSDSN